MNIEDYKRELKDKLIKYRYNLKLPKSLTFGIEIEYENILLNHVSKILFEAQKHSPNFKGWKNRDEIDICKFDENGLEYNGEVISPILTDETQSWINLKTVLELLKNNGGVVTQSCGGHINIGAHIFKGNYSYFRNFLLLWILYENEIFKFSSGEYSEVRSNNTGEIERIVPVLKHNIKKIINEYSTFPSLDKISETLTDKRHDISLRKVRGSSFSRENVIEIRLPNPTLSEEIFQNYINFFSKLLLASTKDLDIEKILYKIKNNDHSILELVDLVFTDDLDKTNFLIQSLKTNPIYKKSLQKHIIRQQ